MNLATENSRNGFSPLVMAVALLLIAAPASSQPAGTFVIDHQHVYMLEVPMSGHAPITLMDQFIETQNEVTFMDRFSLPVDKNGEGILNPEWHYTWWKLEGDLSNPFAHVIVRNQFGDQSLDVGPADYLLAPTLKNSGPGRVPDLTGVDGETTVGPDHYKCYQVFGAPMTKDVALSHQFGTFTNTVMEPRYLCNPVNKKHAGAEYPINNPDDHLVCYQILPNGLPVPLTVGIYDQFLETQVVLRVEDLLCVPSEKEIPTQVQVESWGSLKAIYR